jgi:hypothetical protein
MYPARTIGLTTVVGAVLMAVACGKTVSRTVETLPASGGGTNSAPGPADNADPAAKQNQANSNTAGTPAASTSPAPSADPLAPSSPEPSTAPTASVAPGSSPAPGASAAPTRQFVVDGGPVSGFLQDGRIYFAPNISYFYTASFTSSANLTTVTGELYFKEAALNPEGNLTSRIHAGPCTDIASKPYQHIPGNASPGESEILIPLSGTGTAKKGTGTGNFAFRNEPISWVIQFENAPSKRFCADLQVTAR